MDLEPIGRPRVAFFGGSFDPPHLGHLEVARAARLALDLDTVLFAPVGEQPLKPRGSTAAFIHRLAMTRLAIAGDPAFAVSLADAPRSSGEPNYTLETLIALRAQLPPEGALFCLMGADAFAGLRRWHRAAEIPFIAPLIVASRPSDSQRSLDNLNSALPDGLTIEPVPVTDDLVDNALGTAQGGEKISCGKASSASHEVSGHDFSRAVHAANYEGTLAAEGHSSSKAQIALRRYILRNPAGRQSPFYLLPGLDIDISASEIRDHIRTQTPQPAELPASVSEYIRAHRLYL